MESDQLRLMQLMRNVNNSNDTVRGESELELSEIRRNDGFVKLLVDIISDTANFKDDDRLIAVCCLHENVKRYYQATEGDVIAENDKVYLKMHIVDSISLNHFDSRISATFDEILHVVVESDYPHRWRHLPTTVVDRLQRCEKVTDLFGAMHAVNVLLKSVALNVADNRAALESIVNNVYPLYHQLVVNQFTTFSSDSPAILYLAYKSFLHICTLEMPTCIGLDCFDALLGGIVKILRMDRQSHSALSYAESIKNDGKVECKLLRVVCQCVQSISNHIQRADEDDALAAAYVSRYSVDILDTMLASLASHDYQSYRACTSMVRTIINSMKIEACMLKMRNFVHKILFDIALPMLRLNDKDLAYIHDGEVDYLYSLANKCDDHNMVKNSVEDLIVYMCKHIDGLLYDLINYISSRLDQTKDLAERECLLYAFECTADMIAYDRNIRANLPAFFEKYCLEDLNGDPVLKVRILSLYSKIGYLFTFENTNSYFRLCQSVCNSMNSSNAVIKLLSCDCLTVLFHFEPSREMLIGDTKQIVKILLDAMASTEYDGLLTTLRAIINKCGDSEVQPNTIIASICEVVEATADDAMRRQGMDIIALIIRCYAVDDSWMARVYRLINLGLADQDDGILESALSMVASLSYTCTAMTDRLHRYLPVLFHLVAGGRKPSRITDPYNDGFDVLLFKVEENHAHMYFLSHICSFVANLMEQVDITVVGYDGRKYIDIIFELMRAIANASLAIRIDYSQLYVMTLMSQMMQSYKNKIDSHVQTIIDICLGYIERSESTVLTDRALSTMASAVAYNSRFLHVLADTSLGQKNALSAVVERRFVSTRDSHKKIFVMMMMMVDEKQYVEKPQLMQMVCEAYRQLHTSESEMIDDEEDEWVDDGNDTDDDLLIRRQEADFEAVYRDIVRSFKYDMKHMYDAMPLADRHTVDLIIAK